jgi:hypothetical protein
VLDFAREARVWTLGRCQYRNLEEMDMNGCGGLLRQEMDLPLEFLCLDHQICVDARYKLRRLFAITAGGRIVVSTLLEYWKSEDATN